MPLGQHQHVATLAGIVNSLIIRNVGDRVASEQVQTGHARCHMITNVIRQALTRHSASGYDLDVTKTCASTNLECKALYSRILEDMQSKGLSEVTSDVERDNFTWLHIQRTWDENSQYLEHGEKISATIMQWRLQVQQDIPEFSQQDIAELAVMLQKRRHAVCKIMVQSGSIRWGLGDAGSPIAMPL